MLYFFNMINLSSILNFDIQSLSNQKNFAIFGVFLLWALVVNLRILKVFKNKTDQITK